MRDREAVDRLADHLPGPFAREHGFRRGKRWTARFDPAVSLVELRQEVIKAGFVLALFLAKPHQRDVDDNAAQPPLQRTAPFVGIDLAKRLDDALLEYLLGIVFTPGETPRDRQEGGPHLGHQLAVRVVLTSFECFDQGFAVAGR